MTPQELKNSILQLAIQGKLVPQRAEEGTSEELYNQIQAEKQKLIKAGKIKKEKPLPEITDDEKPFEIPNSWKWVRLYEILDVRDGTHDTPKYVINGIPLVTSKNLINNTIDFETAKLISIEDARNINIRSAVDTGDILFAMIGTIGNPVLVKKDREFCIKNMALFKVIDCKLFDMLYLFWYLQKEQDTMKKKASGGVQSFVSLKYLRNYLLPLPPLAEQKRIVAKIEKLLPYVERYEKAYNELQQLNKRFPVDLQKSVLQLAIQGRLVSQCPEEGNAEELYNQIQAEKQNLIKAGKIKKEKPLPAITDDEKPFEIPESWKWVRLGEIGYSNIGLTYNPKDITDNGVIVLRSCNIQNNDMSYEDIVRVKMEIPQNKMCCKGDILICARNGSKRLVGKAAIIDREGMSFGAFMAIYRSQCNKYILKVINSSYFKNTLLGDTGTTTINQITQNMLKNVPVPLPPIVEQKRIVAKLEEILPLCDKLK